MADLTAVELLALIEHANEEKHPAHQAYVDELLRGMDEVLIDGYLDLHRIAALINEHSRETAHGR